MRQQEFDLIPHLIEHSEIAVSTVAAGAQPGFCYGRGLKMEKIMTLF